MLTRNIRLTLSLIWWRSRAGLPAQLLPVTQQAGGPRGRKLPGFTVASEAPPLPFLLSLTSVTYLCNYLKNQSTPGWLKRVFSMFCWILGCFQTLGGGVRPCIHPRPLCRRRLQFTAELRCTSRVMRIKSTV